MFSTVLNTPTITAGTAAMYYYLPPYKSSVTNSQWQSMKSESLNIESSQY